MKIVPFVSSSLIHLTYLSSASRRPFLSPRLNCHFLTVSVNAPAMSNASMVKKEMTTEKIPMSVMSCILIGLELEGWYNPHRRHSALGYHSPETYENDRQSQA